MTDLWRFLDAAGPGPIADAEGLIKLLPAVWYEFDGADVEAMTSRKIGRLASPTWQPPLLVFRIERHGALAMGGTRASGQIWTVDLRKKTAAVEESRSYRQVYPRAAPLRVGPLVDELVERVVGGVDDPRLVWNADRSEVKLRVGLTIPDDGYQQTVQGRRRRLRAALQEALPAHGWNRARGDRYVRDLGHERARSLDAR